jgi:hypothetical protein
LKSRTRYSTVATIQLEVAFAALAALLGPGYLLIN